MIALNLLVITVRNNIYRNGGLVVERSPRQREVLGLIRDRVIPKTL